MSGDQTPDMANLYFFCIRQELKVYGFKSHIYENHEAWKADLEKYAVRLQWDPDHNPVGGKLERKAIQLGLKGDILEKFNEEWISEIRDITSFVKEQYQFTKGDFTSLEVPFERVLELGNLEIEERIGIERMYT